VKKREYDRIAIDPIEMVIEEVQGSRSTYVNVSILIEEVSYKGVRFVSDIEFLIDETIHFHYPSINVLHLVSGRIVWKKELQTNKYQYGMHVLNG
jgi:hypothetical protein